jgi:cell fate (sporulation/competence/biofilm development) regulator YlbF (YheA/YmcA/DUF963 family)
MNVYEEAHNLAQAIKESNEFKELDRLKKEVRKDEQLASMLDDFQKKQFEIHVKQMSGQQVDQQMMEQVQSMYTMLSAKPIAAEFIQAEARFGVMMKDVYEILANAADLAK